MNNLKYWILISFLIHALFFLSFVVVYNFEPDTYKKKEKLIVEFEGEIAKEQKEQKQLKDNQIKQESQQAQQKVQEQKAQDNPQENQQIQEDIKKEQMIQDEKAIKKVVEQQPKPKTPPKEQQKQQIKPKEEVKQIVKKEEIIQSNEQIKKQKIEDKKQDINEFKKYLSRLKKQLQNNIIYPKEAKDLGYIGNPEVEFFIKEDGDIDKNSIKIVKSSGYEILDNYAIESILKSAPFEKPQKTLAISIEVAFSNK